MPPKTVYVEASYEPISHILGTGTWTKCNRPAHDDWKVKAAPSKPLCPKCEEAVKK